ncbi:hypothetical protein [Clostridium perfringens]|uniref:hypothetical protein n=1 Tax=Clostridium perfringens TaxID=1502 RepID=UPI002FCD10FD
MIKNVFKKKDTSISLEKYFELVKPKYIYIKITPHKSTRNYNTTNIAKAIALSYKGLNERIKREQKKIWVETNFKISYMIDIVDKNANFYFVIPQVFKTTLIEKLREIWSKSTVEEVDPVEPISKDASVFELTYNKEDALSISVDKKTNEPLNQILSVIEIMQEGDRVSVLYNFMPCTQFGWQARYDKAIELFKAKKPLERDKKSAGYIVKKFLNILVETLETISNVISDYSGAKRQTNKQSFAEVLATALESNKEISNETKKKKELQVINTQIAICSKSEDKTREYNNGVSVCQAYRVLDSDNQLLYKKHNSNINIEDYNIGTEINTVSTDECQNFIQVPGRLLLTQLGIKHIKVNENPIPIQLREGIKCLGDSTYKGVKIPAYLENDYDIGNLPLVDIGGQGAGKTTFMSNYAKSCCDAGECVIVLDFIKNCELSDSIKSYVGGNKVVELDMASEDTIQGLGYNEIRITKEMSSFEKMKLANLQSQQIMSLIDAVSVGDPLSSRMRRFLNAAANIVFVQGYNSVRNVVECLERHEKRLKYVENLDRELKEFLEDEINTLNELNEYSKISKKESEGGMVPQVIGTYSSKVEHILDRIGMLREDFKLKYMYNKSLENNVDLVKLMDKGNVVLIKMKEGDFPSKMAKNILITYWISKIWLASQLRGMKAEKPNRVNILVDEVFQAPTCLKTLEYILPQSRKFACKFIFSTQYIRQLESIFDTLEASNSSYMLMRGCLEDDFNHFKSKLDEFEYEDLRDMKKFHSLNLIYYSGGYSSFITKLPYDKRSSNK